MKITEEIHDAVSKLPSIFLVRVWLHAIYL
jgi:hypothetical protein